jgi:Fic family protein
MLNTHTISITPSVLELISLIDSFNAAWQAVESIAPEKLLALRHVATIESVASSTRIEGSKLSNEQVDVLLANLKIKNFKTRDEQEVAGYAEVMELLFASWEHIPFNENHIQQLHRDLLVYSDKDLHHRGRYKTISNSVGAFNEKGVQVAVVFETATPFNTPRLMQELVDWVRYSKDNRTLHPLLIVAVFTVVFLEIHPFEDGNGRLSRILTTLLMLQCGYAYVPYSSLESIIEQNKQGYYIALRQTQGTIRTESTNWQPWLQFFLSALASQVKRLSEKVAVEKLMTLQLPQLSSELLHLARTHGRLTTAKAQQQTTASKGAVKLHLANLVKGGLLIKHGVGRGTWYTAGSFNQSR